MDEKEIRAVAEAHAAAVVAGDMDHVMGDITASAVEEVGALAGQLPSPVTAASVVNMGVTDNEAVADIVYSNDEARVVLRSYWSKEASGSAPKIFRAEIL